MTGKITSNLSIIFLHIINGIFFFNGKKVYLGKLIMIEIIITKIMDY